MVIKVSQVRIVGTEDQDLGNDDGHLTVKLEQPQQHLHKLPDTVVLVFGVGGDDADALVVVERPQLHDVQIIFEPARQRLLVGQYKIQVILMGLPEAANHRESDAIYRLEKP